MNTHVRTLTIYYDAPITPEEIPEFRRAVLRSMGGRAGVLYHNHTGQGTYRYAYPLIQYKRLRGKAAIVCVGDGTDCIGQFVQEDAHALTIGRREVACSITRIIPARLFVQTWEQMFAYRIVNWLPLNTKNYHLYLHTSADEEKKSLLEQILKGNILSMLKGLDIHIEKELKLEITCLCGPHIVYYKKVALMSFTADFSCNLTLPDGLGLGKNASVGNGVVWRKRKETKNTENVE